MAIPRLLISAGHKSSGKTTLCVGLIAALRKRGFNVQPFKKGPDYIDPLWLQSAAGRACQNLDFYMMSRSEIVQSFVHTASAADIAVIEGNKGLYDGLDLDGSNSNAALAHLLKTPVVLALDARGMTRGIAPLILGYQAFDRDINIAGVILNKLGGARHESKLRAIIEHYTDVRVLGAVHRHSDLTIEQRHLGLQPSGELDRAPQCIESVRDIVGDSVDLDAIMAVAATALPLGVAAPAAATVIRSDIRIGIARDAAFSFYYASDLAALEAAGAELVFFDTLQNPRLPDVDALWIGGGFPETQMPALAANASLHADIRHFIDAGGPVYAECGGLMYLARSIDWRGQRYAMVGALPVDSVMEDKPVGRGYVRLRETGRNPWLRSSQGGAGTEIAAHEFHHSRLVNLDPEVEFAYEVLRGFGADGSHDGLVLRNMLASYTHQRDSESNRWTKRFTDHIRHCKSTALSPMQDTG
ncbi:MAG: cobyrinate a,c-diamide synthase [Gammaproteobacteria bacterium]|nr:cobyrinate a,c-diamide synthase [Gammaproteobacteria bacterium]MDH3467974.1 cobyrinate a,c-diamide synthase [Gammaproteobacteria bacterium]